MYGQFLNYVGAVSPVDFIEQQLTLLFDSPQLIDELYCQLIKQTSWVSKAVPGYTTPLFVLLGLAL